MGSRPRVRHADRRRSRRADHRRGAARSTTTRGACATRSSTGRSRTRPSGTVTTLHRAKARGLEHVVLASPARCCGSTGPLACRAEVADAHLVDRRRSKAPVSRRVDLHRGTAGLEHGRAPRLATIGRSIQWKDAANVTTRNVPRPAGSASARSRTKRAFVTCSSAAAALGLGDHPPIGVEADDLVEQMRERAASPGPDRTRHRAVDRDRRARARHAARPRVRARRAGGPARSRARTPRTASRPTPTSPS